MKDVVMLAIVAACACWAYSKWLNFKREESGLTIETSEGGGFLKKCLVVGLCAAYIMWPIDIVPDFIPVLGWGDDVAAAVIGVRALMNK